MQAADGSDKILQLGLIEHYNPVFKFLENAVVSPKFITSQRLTHSIFEEQKWVYSLIS